MNSMSEKKQEYTGSERRTVARRQNIDRRKQIRFEPAKEDRRKKPGRRSTDFDYWQSTI